jgi:hypothetical protein
MPRNMSFMLTTEQVRNRTKTVTRRLGWWNIKDGEILNACVKCQGLKKGEKVERICQIRVLNHRGECLYHINNEEVVKEGFPDGDQGKFIDMFCSHNKCTIYEVVNRIEFEYL